MYEAEGMFETVVYKDIDHQGLEEKSSNFRKRKEIEIQVENNFFILVLF